MPTIDPSAVATLRLLKEEEDKVLTNITEKIKKLDDLLAIQHLQVLFSKPSGLSVGTRSEFNRSIIDKCRDSLTSVCAAATKEISAVLQSVSSSVKAGNFTRTEKLASDPETWTNAKSLGTYGKEEKALERATAVTAYARYMSVLKEGRIVTELFKSATQAAITAETLAQEATVPTGSPTLVDLEGLLTSKNTQLVLAETASSTAAALAKSSSAVTGLTLRRTPHVQEDLRDIISRSVTITTKVTADNATRERVREELARLAKAIADGDSSKILALVVQMNTTQSSGVGVVGWKKTTLEIATKAYGDMAVSRYRKQEEAEKYVKNMNVSTHIQSRKAIDEMYSQLLDSSPMKLYAQGFTQHARWRADIEGSSTLQNLSSQVPLTEWKKVIEEVQKFGKDYESFKKTELQARSNISESALSMITKSEQSGKTKELQELARQMSVMADTAEKIVADFAGFQRPDLVQTLEQWKDAHEKSGLLVENEEWRLRPDAVPTLQTILDEAKGKAPEQALQRVTLTLTEAARELRSTTAVVSFTLETISTEKKRECSEGGYKESCKWW